MRRKRRRTRLWLLAAVICLAGVAALLSLCILAKPRGLVDKLGGTSVVVDLPSGEYRVSPEIARGHTGAEPFAAMIERVKPFAAISGTYFDTDRRPLGDLVIDGKVVRRGCQRQGVGFTAGGGMRFMERRGRSRIDWSGCVSGIACGPRLVREGRVDIDVRRDGFSLAASTRLAARSAVGATSDGKLILCAIPQPIDLGTLAEAMLELGARDAVNLDGGSMCALYSEGKCRVYPSQPVTNILVVHKIR